MDNDFLFVAYYVQAKSRDEKPVLHGTTVADIAAGRSPYPELVGLNVSSGLWRWSGHRYRIGECRNDAWIGPVGVFDLDDPVQVKRLAELMPRIHGEH